LSYGRIFSLRENIQWRSHTIQWAWLVQDIADRFSSLLANPFNLLQLIVISRKETFDAPKSIQQHLCAVLAYVGKRPEKTLLECSFRKRFLDAGRLPTLTQGCVLLHNQMERIGRFIGVLTPENWHRPPNTD